MRAMVLRTHGGPEVLVEETLPDPIPGPGEVRVRVEAVALNHVDLWTRRGMAHLKLTYPFMLGADVAGIIDALGPGVTGLTVGDPIVVNPGHSCMRCEACLSGRDNLCRAYQLMGEDRSGGYCELLCVPHTNIVPRPASLSATDAAAIPVTFLTAWQMLTRKGQLRPGQDVLIVAAGSGVGVAAVQIAKLLGARVIATASTEDKRDKVKALGADEVLAPGPELAKEVKRLTDKRGVDLVFEHVGGDLFEQAILSAKWGGRVVTCGATAGFRASFDLRQVFFRQVEILGSTMAPKGDLFDILRHVAAGRLKPVIDRILPLSQARQAHELLEARAVFGKIVLKQ